MGGVCGGNGWVLVVMVVVRMMATTKAGGEMGG